MSEASTAQEIKTAHCSNLFLFPSKMPCPCHSSDASQMPQESGSTRARCNLASTRSQSRELWSPCRSCLALKLCLEEHESVMCVGRNWVIGSMLTCRDIMICHDINIYVNHTSM